MLNNEIHFSRKENASLKHSLHFYLVINFAGTNTKYLALFLFFTLSLAQVVK